MPLAPTIVYLLLDPAYDPVFDPKAALVDASAVQQAILTRLNLWQGEWWEQLSIGLPVFQQILGQLGDSRGQAAMALAIQQVIEGTPYVTAVEDVQYQFVNSQFSFTASVRTAFGLVTVNYTPGLSVSL
jgi:hypothetical protein